MKINRDFFARNALEVAKELVGKRLVREVKGSKIELVITEISAHEGGSPTQARNGMNYAPGRIFLMPFRGRLFLNIATDHAGMPSCVFIRKGADITGKQIILLDGPAKLTKHLRIFERMDGELLNSELFVEDSFVDPKLVAAGDCGTAENCLGCFTYPVF
jgi:3-methyladenine DNA glycosylase Mpg